MSLSANNEMENQEYYSVDSNIDNIDVTAYIRPLLIGKENEEKMTAYAVYNSSGEQLAVFGNYDAAFFSARQNNLDPVQVH